MRKLLYLILFSLFALFMAMPVDASIKTINFTVTDADTGAPIGGAVISYEDYLSGAKTEVTGPLGTAIVHANTESGYTLSGGCTKRGYDSESWSAGATVTELSIEMQKAGGATPIAFIPLLLICSFAMVITVAIYRRYRM